MRFDLEHHQTRLELRILELEDTVATLSRIARTLHEAITGTLDTVHTHADRIGGLILALPTTASHPIARVYQDPATGRTEPDCCERCASIATPPPDGD